MRLIPGTLIPVAPLTDEKTLLVYVGSDGTTVTLTDPANGLYVMPGTLGLGNVPYALQIEEVPAMDGGVLRGVRRTVRDLFVPLYLEAPTRLALLSQLRAIENTLDPADGGGYLRVLQSNGTARRIGAVYTGGMEGDEGADAAGLRWQTFGLAFKALDPTWVDEASTYFRWIIGVDTPFFPILPLTLTESSIIGTDVPIDNTGDELAWPVWRIVGKCSAVTFTNSTTGQSFTLNHTQTSPTQHVDIDTRPGVKTVKDEGGTNLWPSMAPSPQLWPLRRGRNSVSLAVTGTDVTTYVEMTYTPRYKAAA